jgi:hypothetical protein
LGYHFTLLTGKNRLTVEDKKLLSQFKTDFLEIDVDENEAFAKLYELAEEGGYLLTPDQYVLGRWRVLNVNTVVDLIAAYMAGNVFEEGSLIKTEQEIIDEKVAKMLRNAHLSTHVNQK